jgi:hypothetical protein
MSYKLTQEHLDMLNYMKQETVALLSNGDNSPHNDNIRRFSNLFDVIAGLAGSIIHIQAEQKAMKQIARGEPVTAIVETNAAIPPSAAVAAPVEAPLTLEPPAPIAPVVVAPEPEPAPAPVYSFGPAN